MPKPTQEPLTHGHQKHNWKQYADGQTWEFTKGEDYTNMLTFRSLAYRWAKDNNYRAITRDKGETILLKFVPLVTSTTGDKL